MTEEDAQNMLELIASNGLVTNPSKTAMVILNSKSDIMSSDMINQKKSRARKLAITDL